MAGGKEKFKSLLMKVKEESEKSGFKLNIQKANIMASGPITSWQRWGNSGNSDRLYYWGGSKITAWWLRWLSVCLQWGRPEFDPGSGRSPGEGNGNPLQYSFLENPRDGGAWWAAIYGIAQSQTRLKRLNSSSSSISCLKLLIFLPAILIPACASSSPAFRMIYSAYKLNKQGENI